MSDASPAVYAGRHRAVLDHEGHREGINHGVLIADRIEDLAPSVTRVHARVDHEGDPQRWLVANPAIRLELPDARTGETVSRVYTVRSAVISDGVPRIVVDIVRHPGASPVMDFLATLQIGTTVRILGPRPHFTPLIAADAIIGLFADETAIPALGSILEHWPEGARASAWVETPDEAVLADLPAVPGVEIHWCRRDDAAPGTTGALVAAALAFSAEHPGEVSIWAAGEHGEMRAIRNHFRRERGLGKEPVQVFGYWRREVSSTAIDHERLRRYEAALQADPEFRVLDEFED